MTDNIHNEFKALNNKLRKKNQSLEKLGFYTDPSDIDTRDIGRNVICVFEENIDLEGQDYSVSEVIDIFNDIKKKASEARIRCYGSYDGDVFIEAIMNRDETDDEFNDRVKEIQSRRFAHWKAEYDFLMSEITDIQEKITKAEEKLKAQSSEEVTRLYQLAKMHGFVVTKAE
jgi:hypothetical protein